MSMHLENGCVWVELSLTEMLNAANVGIVRHHESTKRNHKFAHGFVENEKTALCIDIEGAMGEVCVAKVLDRYYEGTVNTFKGADIGKDIQVRCRSKHDYDLIVRDDDNPNHFYIHVTGTAPNYCVRGWMRGEDAKQPKYLAGHGGRVPAYFVPEKDLKKIPLQNKAFKNDATT
jgi:hypothetical protein